MSAVVVGLQQLYSIRHFLSLVRRDSHCQQSHYVDAVLVSYEAHPAEFAVIVPRSSLPLRQPARPARHLWGA